MSSQTKTETRFTKQIVVAILVIVGVVAGVTLISHYQSTTPFVGGGGITTGGNPTGQPNREDRVTVDFPLNAWQWEPESAGEFEEHTPGHHDFWFRNLNKVTLKVGIDSKSCKCSSISICVLEPKEKDKYLRWVMGAAVFQLGQFSKFGQDLGLAAHGLLGLTDFTIKESPAVAAVRGVKLDWKKFDQFDTKDVDHIPVPPQSWGIVRLFWDGQKDKIGKETLTVALWTQVESNRATAKEHPPRLEFPHTYVKSLLAAPAKANVETLGIREEKTVEFTAWSSTRASFPLAARELSNDKCFSCKCEPLPPEELVKLADTKGTRVLAGYRIRVTLRERLSDAVQMDLGPFQRRIVLESPILPEPEYLLVTGAVKGDVMVGSELGEGRIILESFRARTGTTKQVIITTELAELDLSRDQMKLEPESLNYMKVSLKQLPRVGGKPRWELTLHVPPGGPPGRLPDHSAILLRLPGNPPRAIRIPIKGVAYQQ